MSAGALAIVAGAGGLPVEIATIARQSRAVAVFPLKGFADRTYRDFDGEPISLFDPTAALATFRRYGAEAILLAGGVQKPGLSALAEGWQALRNRDEVRAIIEGGDDSVLRGVVRFLESSGFEVVGVDAVAPTLLAPSGVLAAPEPSAADREDIEMGRAVLAALGPFDVGQAAVVCRKRILGLEAVEGTDALLRRVALQRRPGVMARVIRHGRPPVAEQRGGVLVKALKPGQDRRVDLPVIGARTVELAARAGLSGIAIAAGQVLILEREKTFAAAQRCSVWIFGGAP